MINEFAQVESRRRARLYLLGLLSAAERKNSWTIAEQAGDLSPDGMQRLLNHYRWDADAVRDTLRGYVLDRIGDSGGWWWLMSFRTAIDRRDNGGVVINVFYKHSRIKQYLKDGRAMRIETVINMPRDLGCNARLPNLDDLQTKARACNRRILDAQRVGQGCVLASPAFARIAHPSVTTDGRRTPALRFGDPRVMALPTNPKPTPPPAGTTHPRPPRRQLHPPGTPPTRRLNLTQM